MSFQLAPSLAQSPPGIGMLGAIGGCQVCLGRGKGRVNNDSFGGGDDIVHGGLDILDILFVFCLGVLDAIYPGGLGVIDQIRQGGDCA